MPPNVPVMNPARRPNRCISAESGVADSIEPSTINEIGSVARQGLGASDWPASPPMVKIIGICEPRTACAATSTATLRRARPSRAGKDAISVMWHG